MRTTLFACIVILLPSLAVAGAFEVAPTTITFQPGARFAALYITNRGTHPVSAQIEAFDWLQTNSKDQLTPSDALIVSPPMVRLLPGHKQTVRLAVDPDPTNSCERSFRLVVSELPDPEAKPSDAVQVLLQFNVPVFMAAIDKKPLILEWNIAQSPEGFLLTVQNEGTRHAKLSDLTLTLPSGQDIAVASDSFSYVLTNTSHSWKITLPAASPVTGTLKLKAKDETDGIIYSSVLVAH